MPKGSIKAIPKVKVNLKPSTQESQQLLTRLQERFNQNMGRHPDHAWSKIRSKLEKQPKKLASLHAMETTGGQPDVVQLEPDTKQITFADCSPQSPDRRKICYDHAGEQARIKKDLHPGGNAVDLAQAMSIELLDEQQYCQLQQLGEFDTSTSSWILTPPKIRQLGGALFCDRRYDTIFTYHNSSESFYSARGFRGLLHI